MWLVITCNENSLKTILPIELPCSRSGPSFPFSRNSQEPTLKQRESSETTGQRSSREPIRRQPSLKSLQQLPRARIHGVTSSVYNTANHSYQHQLQSTKQKASKHQRDRPKTVNLPQPKKRSNDATKTYRLQQTRGFLQAAPTLS
jgi:hypothetical protein